MTASFHDFEQLEYTVSDGILADIAPTLLEMMGITPSPEMTGTSLLKKK